MKPKGIFLAIFMGPQFPMPGGKCGEDQYGWFC